MVARILTVPILVLALGTEAAGQPTPPDPGFDRTARDSALAAGMARAREQMGQRQTLPPIAERSTAQLDRTELPAVLTGVATWLRDVYYAGRDSILIADRLDAAYRGSDHDPNHEYIVPTAAELALLRRELRGGTASRDSVIGPCRPVYGCELKAPRFAVLGQPLLRVDGTVTMILESWSRRPDGSLFARTGISEIVLTRRGDTWMVTALHPRVVS